MHGDDIADLIGRVALGDRSGFRGLYNQTRPKLFAICLRILKDRTEAEEALQEVYIRSGSAPTQLLRRLGSSDRPGWRRSPATDRSMRCGRASPSQTN